MNGANSANVGNRISGGVSAAPGPPAGNVEQHLIEMDGQLEGAHNRLSILENRLVSALRASGPSGANEANTQLIASPVAEKLRGQCVGVAALTARINDLIDRIDL